MIKHLDKHEVDAVLGTSVERTKLDWETIQGSVFTDDTMQYISAAATVTNESSYNLKKHYYLFCKSNYAFMMINI